MAYHVKQVIVVRNDLKIRKGKSCSQAAHASCDFLVRHLLGSVMTGRAPKPTEDEIEWMTFGMAKIIARVDSLEELMKIVEQAKAAGLTTSLITDAGHTEFNNIPTITAAAIGPNKSVAIDKITGELNLL